MDYPHSPRPSSAIVEEELKGAYCIYLQLKWVLYIHLLVREPPTERHESIRVVFDASMASNYAFFVHYEGAQPQ